MFRWDRNEICSGQKSGGGTLLRIPKNFNPKILEDLNYLRPSYFEGIWVESSPIISQQSKRQVKALAYNPKKHFKQLFIKNTLKGIGYVALKARDLTIFGDLNINYLNKLANFQSDLIKQDKLSVAKKQISRHIADLSWIILSRPNFFVKNFL